MASKKGKTTGGPSAVSKTHKSFQPVLPCGNKLLQQKWDQTYYNDHQKLIKSAKPMVDNKPPPARPHIVSKLKKQQLEKERLEEIDRDNLTLLKKMQRIMKTEGDVDHSCTSHQYRHSLNEEKRRREVRRVSTENKQMIKRLETVAPMYRMSNWVDDWQRKEELTSMITAYPENLAAAIPVAKKIQPETAADTGKEVQAESSTATDGQAESCTATDGKAQELLNTENTGGTAEISIE